jgi:(S)-2-hydroxyglutarate dehydrogenase
VVASEVQGATPPARCDLAVVGGGIVGMAVARELLARHPRSSLCVIERERAPAAHQTGHSSGVIHAGVYYRPGSLKAKLCVEGARKLYAYCAQRGIAHERCGKLIVATRAAELARLDELERRGRANRVAGLRRLDADEIADIEPHARGVAGLHSPDTGIVDFAEVTHALARDVLDAGAAITTGCEITGVVRARAGLRLTHGDGAIEAGHAIFCAGAWSDRLAVLAGAGRDPRIVPFRGAYMRLAPERRELVRALIYPVPDPSLPFLGVHLTRRLSGEVLVGPTALPALARDPGRSREASMRDALDTLAWPGTWRMLARFWRTGLHELHRAASRSAFARRAARYVPELSASDLMPAFAGVRAQALARDGRLLDDFAFSVTERALHVRNAPSPAATAALAIARHVADRLHATFGPAA